MRVFAVLLFVTLAGSAALAQPQPEPRPARPRPALRVLRTMPETRQALVIDTDHNTYLVIGVGGTVDGLTVADVDDETVTFDAPNGIELVLVAPAKVGELVQGSKTASATVAAVTTAPAAAENPERVQSEPLPIDPYVDQEIRTVEAPPAPVVVSAITSGDSAVVIAAPVTATAPATATTAAPAAAAVAAPATVAVAVPATATVPAPATVAVAEPVTVTAPAAPVLPPDAPIVLSRALVDSALAHFAQLAASVRTTVTPNGLRVDWLAPDSLFVRAGLAARDVVVSVDGHPLRTLDDAATLYARAATARNITIQAVRADKPITLRVAIQ
jgi:hypothetical protein